MRAVRRAFRRAAHLILGRPTGVPPWIRSAQDAPACSGGVNVIGYVHAESGMGQFARLLLRTLAAAGVPFTVIPIVDDSKRSLAVVPEQELSARQLHAINVMCVNADALPSVVGQFPMRLFRRRVTVGYWAWEVATFPAQFTNAGRMVDEIWALSHHAADAIGAGIDRPVRALPLPIEVDDNVGGKVEEGGPFTFLVCFDYYSVFQRKNPIAAINAFKQAFPNEGQGARLVVKSTNAGSDPESAAAVSDAVGGRTDIEVLDSYLSPAEQMALIRSCDAYVSLHRAEGFGLMLGEAMAYGRPVIATGYSGNLEFMHSSNSFLVPYRLVAIGDDNPPYPQEGMWAEPDIDAAAAAMRTVFYDRSVALERAERGQQEVRTLHSPAARAALVRSELSRLGQNIT